MRILHIGKYYAPQRGGIERHLQDLAEWFARNGHSVGALVHQSHGEWRTTRETIHGVAVRRAGCLATMLYAPISPSLPWLLHKALGELRPELLHLHLPNPSCFAALLSPRARALPWVVHWHADVSPDMPDWRVRAAYRLYRPFEQAVLARAAAIVVTSRAYLDASEALIRWKKKAVVVGLGIDEQSQTGCDPPAWPNPASLRLLAVGRLSHYKGHAVLFEALARLDDASLLVIGEGEEKSRLQEQAERLGIGDRVSFAGEVDDAGLLAAYASADALVLPSLDRSEAFGIVLIEAMRAGLPVIASDIPGSGVGHVVVDGVTGLLVTPGAADELVAAINQIDDPANRARLGSAGRQRWQDQFTLQQSAQSIERIYRDLTA
ncbi:glycosyltransferase [Dokdonella sp.]|uniref:glycosyltransferase n=1 Tax=Dokdonella sp. TaxID=2291710 RepID=UPI002C3955E4|nr:glycosyltransferase [Dokdonella sp.]HPN80012.1 glycosyltransferase [Dokdonella sp.]